MGKKLTSLNRFISVITYFDEKWFVVFSWAHYQLQLAFSADVFLLRQKK